MDDDGANPTPVTTPFLDIDQRSSISPTGREIYFDRSDGNDNGHTDVWLVKPNGGNPTNLTNLPGYDDEDPDAGPVYVVFWSNRHHPLGELYRMNRDGSNVVRLTENDVEEADPAWCGLGGIVFARRDPPAGDFEIWIRGANPGGAETKLTDNENEDRYPACSPNGAYVAFSRDGFHYTLTDIIRMDLSTGAEENLTDDFLPETSWNYVNELHPSWSPGGTWVAFTRQDIVNNQWDVYKFPVPLPGEPTTGNPTPIAHLAGVPELQPDWGELAP